MTCAAIRPERAPLPRPVALSLLLLAAACTVGPDYQPPRMALPAAWSAGGEARAPELHEWWRRLDDATLTALIEQAVAGNLDVAAARARLREARASYREAGGALAPTLDAAASASRGSASARSAAAQGVSNQYQAGFDAGWEIDLFGANTRAREAARYGLDAAGEDLRAVLLTLVGDVAANYVEARGLQARLALARRTAAAQRQTADLVQAQFDAGAATALDLANARGQTATTEAGIPALEAAYAQTVHRLSVLTGQAPGALNGRMAAGGKIPAPRLPVPTGVPAQILLARPDVRLAERRHAQSTARIGVAEAARYPSVTLSGSISTTGRQIGDLGRGSSIGWSFGPGVNLPLFTGGRLPAAVEAAEALRDQSFVAWRAAVLTALEDVENATVALAQERIRQGRLATAAASYREAAGLSRDLYTSGATSFLDVLTAERSLYSAEDGLLQSRIAMATDYIALMKALGGGWDGRVDSATPEVIDLTTGPRLRTASATAGATPAEGRP